MSYESDSDSEIDDDTCEVNTFTLLGITIDPSEQPMRDIKVRYINALRKDDMMFEKMIIMAREKFQMHVTHVSWVLFDLLCDDMYDTSKRTKDVLYRNCVADYASDMMRYNSTKIKNVLDNLWDSMQ
jgi:hypothetical protein